MRVSLSAAMAAAQRRKADAGQRSINAPKNTPESESALLTEEYNELKKNYQTIQEENLKLQAVITDVTEVNKRWQRYNSDRQMYVDKLLTTIEQQQEQMSKVSPGYSANLSKQNPGNSDVQHLRRENSELREEVDQLRRQLDEKEREGMALRVQAQVHRDDWEAERAEKFTALQQKEAADKRAEQLAVDLRSVAQKLREERIRSPIQCPNCGHCLPFEQTVPVPMSVEPSRRRGSLIARGSYMTSGDEMYLTCDGAANNNDWVPVKQTNVEHTSTDNGKKNCVGDTQTAKNDVTSDSPCASFSVISGEGAVTLGFSRSGLASVSAHSYPPPSAVSQTVQSDSSMLPQAESQRFTPTSGGAAMQSEEEGVVKQTRMDVICPGCRAVYPPGMHIDFLDHFEVCQHQKMPRNPNNCKTLLKCPKCSQTFPAHQQVDFLDHFDECSWPNKSLNQSSGAGNSFMSS